MSNLKQAASGITPLKIPTERAGLLAESSEIVVSGLALSRMTPLMASCCAHERDWHLRLRHCVKAQLDSYTFFTTYRLNIAFASANSFRSHTNCLTLGLLDLLSPCQAY